MKTKICTKCGKEKSVEEFYFKVKCKGWRESICKQCSYTKRKNNDIKRAARNKLKEYPPGTRKVCTVCGRYLLLEDFYINYSKPYGRCSECIECRLKIDKSYLIKVKQEVWPQNTTKRCIECGEYKLLDEFYPRKGKYGRSSRCITCSLTGTVKFSKVKKLFNNLLPYEHSLSVGNDGLVVVKCSQCSEFFNPSYIQLRARMNAINGSHSPGTYNNLYCSDTCKQLCPVFYKKTYQENHPKKPTGGRVHQAEWAAEIRKRADNTCEICGAKNTKLIAHHIQSVKTHPHLSLDYDNGVALCPTCDSHVHKLPGCAPGFLASIQICAA